MTDAQLRDRVVYWQGRLVELGLIHWRIRDVDVLKQLDAGPQARASVSKSDLYDDCHFQFQKEHVRSGDPGVVDEDIVHEWLHVAMRDWDEAVESARSWFPAATYEDFEERVNHEREGVIERLARLIVRLHSDCGTVPTA